MTDATKKYITVIVVNYRTPDLAIACLASLAAARGAGPSFDVVLVDGGSGDDSVPRLAAHIDAAGIGGWVTLLPLSFNGGFGWANNQAIQQVLSARPDTPFFHLLNPDATVAPDAIRLLYEALVADPRAAAAGSRVVSADDRAVAAAFRFPSIGTEFVRGTNTPLLGRLLKVAPLVIDADQEVDADWVIGASVMLRTAALKDVGLFDDGFFLYFEEVELMHRLRARGWRVRHVPTSIVRHVGGGSTGIADGASEQQRLPAYWFQSRRRFYTLVYGANRMRLATVGWMAGTVIATLRRGLGLGGRRGDAPHELRDVLTYGLRVLPSDAVPAVPRWNDPPRRPAWTAWR